MSKRFGALVALDNVSMRVRAGSFHALLGENVAGKSTPVKCIIGYHRPNSGGLIVLKDAAARPWGMQARKPSIAEVLRQSAPPHC
jgi:ABC-type sugar transport system ATPase subunit